MRMTGLTLSSLWSGKLCPRRCIFAVCWCGSDSDSVEVSIKYRVHYSYQIVNHTTEPNSEILPHSTPSSYTSLHQPTKDVRLNTPKSIQTSTTITIWATTSIPGDLEGWITYFDHLEHCDCKGEREACCWRESCARRTSFYFCLVSLIQSFWINDIEWDSMGHG